MEDGMNLRRMMLGIAALATLGTTSALAAPPDVSARQVQAKGALSVFDLGVTNDKVSLSQTGRDLTMVSSQNHDTVLRALKDAYLNESRLPNGYQVAGWAHLVQTDSTTFTLKNDAGERMVAEIFPDAAGTRVKIWGIVRPDAPVRKPLAEIPRRFSGHR
jgi:hypothetical protein